MTHKLPPLKATAGKLAAIAIFKMALLPALVFALLAVFGVADPAYRGAMALFTVTPTAVGAFVKIRSGITRFFRLIQRASS